MIQRGLTCKKRVAEAKESTYLNDQIPAGTLIATINWSHTASQSTAILAGIPDEYFGSKWQNQICMLKFLLPIMLTLWKSWWVSKTVAVWLWHRKYINGCSTKKTASISGCSVLFFVSCKHKNLKLVVTW